jgi:multiple sugar transport system substrate-binding protein
MYYNRALMEQAGLDPESPPTNREEYENALNALQEAGINGQWISPFPFTGMLMFMSLLPQFGGSLYNEEGTEATWDSEAGVEAVEWMLSLIENGHSPADVGQDAETTAFQNGQAAFLWNGIWMVSAFAETPGLDWGVAPIPNIGGEPAVWSGSHNLVITNKGRQDTNTRHAAATFINWVSEESLAWAAAGQVPARTSVREDPGFAELEAQSNFAEQIDYLEFVPTIPGIPEAQIQLEQGYQQAALRLAPVQDALSSSADRATQLMESNVQRYAVQP